MRSQSAARIRVQTGVRVTSPLDARHPPSHLARRDWHLAVRQVAEASSGRNPQPLLMWSGYVRVRPGAYSRRIAARAQCIATAAYEEISACARGRAPGARSARAEQAGDRSGEARRRARAAGALRARAD